MKTADLAQRLDEHFHLDRFESDDFAIIVEFSHEAGVPIEEYATAAFLRRFNGLMLDNGDEVRRVFTAVFPSDEVLAEVERRAAGEPALLLAHHPMDMETSGRGLLPIGEEWLRRLRDGGVSLYAAHAPMDCHETTSTSRALARAIGVPAEASFAGYYGGHAGVHGRIEPVAFLEFAKRVRDALGVRHVEAKDGGEPVRHVAVVAGGAAYPPIMQEAIEARCDTYVTGDFRVRHGGPWADEHRPQFDAYVDAVSLNLIGGSHYATESIVLREDMPAFFAALGLQAEFVPQSDPWR